MYDSTILNLNKIIRIVSTSFVIAAFSILFTNQSLATYGGHHSSANSKEWSSTRGDIRNHTNARGQDQLTPEKIKHYGMKPKPAWNLGPQLGSVEVLPLVPIDPLADTARNHHTPIIVDGVMYVSRSAIDYSDDIGAKDIGILTKIDPKNGKVLQQKIIRREISQELGLSLDFENDPTAWPVLVESARGMIVVDNLLLFNTSGFNQVLSQDIFSLCVPLLAPLFECFLDPDAVDTNIGVAFGGNSFLVAVDKNTLDVRWGVKLDNHPLAKGSGAVDLVEHNGTVYVTQGNTAVYDFNFNSADPTGPLLGPGDRRECCTVMPSVMAIDIGSKAYIPDRNKNGYFDHQDRIKWKTYTTPIKPGEENFDGLGLSINPEKPNGNPFTDRDPRWYRGSGQWAGAPALDLKRGLLYIATGNHNRLPQEALLCERRALNIASDQENQQLKQLLQQRTQEFGSRVTCNGNKNTTSIFDAFKVRKNAIGHRSFGHYSNSIVALQMKTGKVVWAMRAIDWGIAFPECWPGVDNPVIYSANLDPNLPQPQLPLQPQCTDAEKALHNYRYFDLAQNNPVKLPPSNLNGDFAAAPMIVKDRHGRDLVVAGNKAGTFFAIDASKAFYKAKYSGKKPYIVPRRVNSGPLVWKTRNGRGGTSYGANRYTTSTDGKRIYTSASLTDNWGYELFSFGTRDGGDGSIYPRAHKLCYKLNNEANRIAGCRVGEGGLTESTRGYISALDITSGKILWEFAPDVTQTLTVDGTPDGTPMPPDSSIVPAAGTVTGAGNGVLFFVTGEAPSVLYALESKTGNLLWSAPTHELVNDIFSVKSRASRHTAAIADNTVYVGLGYVCCGANSAFPYNFADNTQPGDLMAFELCTDEDLVKNADANPNNDVKGCNAGE